MQQVVPSLLFLAQQSIMSGGIEALQLKEEDVLKLLAAGVHLGASNVDFQMESYVYKRKPDGKNPQCNSLCEVLKFFVEFEEHSFLFTTDTRGIELSVRILSVLGFSGTR